MERRFISLLDFNGGFMKYICSFCNTKKYTSYDKAYVYASSTRAVKVYVCQSCHKRKVRETEDVARANLTDKFVLGILKAEE